MYWHGIVRGGEKATNVEGGVKRSNPFALNSK